MPTISRFYGIVIRMYFADHAPPHFHAVYAGEEAVIGIATGEILRGRCRIARCGWCENGRRYIARSWPRTGTAFRFPSSRPRSHRCHEPIPWAVFDAVTVDREFGTIVWPGDVDLDPDVLRGDEQRASGRALPRRVVQPA